MVTPYSTQTVLSFVRSLLERKLKSPLVIGLSGPQGSGKSSVVKAVANELRAASKLNVVEFSLDDCYLTHDDQVKLAATGNTLVSQRGLPGTHDIPLCVDTLKSLIDQKATDVPQYDKSAFSGQGDRVPRSEFIKTTPPYDVILFEGWCVGFTSVNDGELEERWNGSTGPLKRHRLDHAKYVNDKLKQYDDIWNMFDGFVHLDAESISYVYDWRLQQEHGLIKEKGSGMTDDQVRAFVDGYMPAYELYNDRLRTHEGLPSIPHLRVTLNKNRQPVTSMKL